MENLQVATTGSEYKYWEVIRYGEDKDIFEIVETPISHFKGERYIMQQSTKSGIVMKPVDKYGTDNGDDIITPYGGITGATFKRVEQFTPVTVGEAVEEIKEDKRNVYVQDKNGHFERVTVWTGLDEIEVADFGDLLNRNFFIKN